MLGIYCHIPLTFSDIWHLEYQDDNDGADDDEDDDDDDDIDEGNSDDKDIVIFVAP